MFVKPAEGLLIPDPAMAGTPDYRLPPDGRDVQPSDYWTRRLRDGDVTEVIFHGMDIQAQGVVVDLPLAVTPKASKA